MFTITYLKQTIVLQRFYSYNLWSKHVMVFPTINLLHSYTSTVRSMCAVRSTADCCSSLTSCFPGMFLRYFLNDCEVDPIAPVITGITFVFTLHMRWISTVRFICFRIFSVYLLVTFLSLEFAASTNIHFLFFLLLSLCGRPCLAACDDGWRRPHSSER